jgi:hypothetical protein
MMTDRRRPRPVNVQFLLAGAFVLGTATAPSFSTAHPGSVSDLVTDSISVGTIVGRVTAEGEATGYVNVILLGTRMGTQSDEKGVFRLEGVPVGKQVLRVQQIYCARSDSGVVSTTWTIRHGSRESRMSASAAAPGPGRRTRPRMYPRQPRGTVSCRAKMRSPPRDCLGARHSRGLLRVEDRKAGLHQRRARLVSQCQRLVGMVGASS